MAHAAAQRALQRQLRLARQGRSLLHAFMGRSAAFEVWRHYPRHDAIDVSGRWQFYYHAHDRDEPGSARHAQEHGHIHLFARSRSGRLTHLLGLSLDARGLPLCWFTTNQWVTGEHWQDAPRLQNLLQRLQLRLHGPLAGAALWLSDLVRVYRPALLDLLQQRDEALARHCRRRRQTREQAWADRRVAVWSALNVRWPQDALQTGRTTLFPV
jgi:hypothetical protein